MKRTGFLALLWLSWICVWCVWMAGFSWIGLVGGCALGLPAPLLVLAHRSRRFAGLAALGKSDDPVEPFLGAVVPAWMDAVESAQGETDLAVQDLVRHFRRISSVLESEDVRIRTRCESEITAILVALQFQDRVRQILTHVTADMDALRRDGSLPADADAWRGRFHSHLASGGDAKARESAATGTGADAVTFF